MEAYSKFLAEKSRLESTPSSLLMQIQSLKGQLAKVNAEIKEAVFNREQSIISERQDTADKIRAKMESLQSQYDLVKDMTSTDFIRSKVGDIAQEGYRELQSLHDALKVEARANIDKVTKLKADYLDAIREGGKLESKAWELDSKARLLEGYIPGTATLKRHILGREASKSPYHITDHEIKSSYNIGYTEGE